VALAAAEEFGEFEWGSLMGSEGRGLISALRGAAVSCLASWGREADLWNHGVGPDNPSAGKDIQKRAAIALRSGMYGVF
jgi:hypothetical protein